MRLGRNVATAVGSFAVVLSLFGGPVFAEDRKPPWVEETDARDGVTIQVFLSQTLASGELVEPPEIGLSIEIRTGDGEGPFGGACYRVLLHTGEGASEEHHVDMDAVNEQLDMHGLDDWAAFARCPLEEGEVSKDEAISRFVATVPMPLPDPQIAPGRAITGMPAYLETGIEAGTVDPIAVDVLAGTVMIHPEPTVVEVDWGDGTHPGTYEGQPGPWPDGEVTYAYATLDVVTVRILQRWDAHWSYEGLLGARSGVVSGLWSYGEIVDFPVGEVQAVRDR